MNPSIVEQKILALKKIYEDFKDIIRNEKCRTCSCFHGDVLAKVSDIVKRFNGGQPEEYRLNDIQADFEGWAGDLDLLKMHG
jgi:hypothetical protein